MIDYNVRGDWVEIVIRDYSGKKIEKHSCNMKDKKKYAKILEYLKEKYDFYPEIEPEDSVNFQSGI